MPAAGRSPLLALCVTLALTTALALVVVGPADAQSPTTIAPAPTSVATSVTASVVSSTAVTTASAVTTTVATAGDEESTRTVNRIVAVLVGLAIVLLGLAIWLWRSTKPAPRYLDALDVMGTRSWRDADPAARAVLLAPVHERRGQEPDDDLVAWPEVEAPADVAPDAARDPVDVPALAADDVVHPADAVASEEAAAIAEEVAAVAPLAPEEVAAVDEPPDEVEERAAPRVS